MTPSPAPQGADQDLEWLHGLIRDRMTLTESEEARLVSMFTAFLPKNSRIAEDRAAIAIRGGTMQEAYEILTQLPADELRLESRFALFRLEVERRCSSELLPLIQRLNLNSTRAALEQLLGELEHLPAAAISDLFPPLVECTASDLRDVLLRWPSAHFNSPEACTNVAARLGNAVEAFTFLNSKREQLQSDSAVDHALIKYAVTANGDNRIEGAAAQVLEDLVAKKIGNSDIDAAICLIEEAQRVLRTGSVARILNSAMRAREPGAVTPADDARFFADIARLACDRHCLAEAETAISRALEIWRAYDFGAVPDWLTGQISRLHRRRRIEAEAEARALEEQEKEKERERLDLLGLPE